MISFQEIVVYLLVGIAVAFLLRKFFWKKKKDKDCGDGDCGCS